jgi:GTP-binding protein
VGLGHEFLAHLERANLLLHVIDSSEDDAAERFATIDRELAAYGAGLETRPQAIVLNKIDLRAEPPAFDVEDDRIVRVFRVSCATGAGIHELKRTLFELCPPQAPAATSQDGLVDFLVYRPRPGGRRFRILRTDRGFRISGEAPSDDEELTAALKAAGARTGDEVEVDGEVMEVT